MTAPTLVTSDGAKLSAFGGDSSWHQFQHKHFLVSIEHHEGEPCAVLWPAQKTSNAGAWVVCLSAMPGLIDLKGPNDHAFKRAAAALRTFGMEVDVPNLHALIDAFMQSVPLVYVMPPRRIEKDADDALFEATTRLDGKLFSERAV